jgi:ketosteroid isomerase-like protein
MSCERPALALAAAALLAAVLSGCVTKAPPPRQATLDEVANAERAFAARSLSSGMKQAFLDNLEPGAILLRPDLVDGRKWIADRPDPPIVLDWKPVFVDAAAAGDLALSTGPWKRASKTDAARPPAYGQFVSIWRRGKDGAWKVLLDHGISHDGAALWDAPLSTGAATAASDAHAGGDLAAAEARFATDAATRGMRAALAGQASDAIRVYREGRAPLLGKAAAIAVEDAKPANYRTERFGISRSNDFAWVLGSYGREGAPPEAWAVRVWRRAPAGWQIEVDVMTPRPPGKPG